MKKVVVLSGAGISAESGIRTFRDSNGLWEEHKIEDVASPEGWQRNMEMVLQFYNIRRKQLLECMPNPAHFALVRLQDKFDVQIITQNIDDLHERAGALNVLHLHGELRKARSTVDEMLIYDINGWELNKGDKCEKGSQLRPHVVWFGEPVPNIMPAAEISAIADIYIIVGTSLNVYPAAGLINYAPDNIPRYLIDPMASQLNFYYNLTIFREKAAKAIPLLVDKLLKEYD